VTTLKPRGAIFVAIYKLLSMIKMNRPLETAR